MNVGSALAFSSRRPTPGRRTRCIRPRPASSPLPVRQLLPELPCLRSSQSLTFVVFAAPPMATEPTSLPMITNSSQETGGSAVAPARKMSAAHKAALAKGREQANAVRAYLDALEANRPKRGRKRTPESISKRIAAIDTSTRPPARLDCPSALAGAQEPRSRAGCIEEQGRSRPRQVAPRFREARGRTARPKASSGPRGARSGFLPMSCTMPASRGR